MVVSVGSGLTVLLGGARSGKSDCAVAVGRQWNGPVTFVATAEPGDGDMALRIRTHQEDRPKGWGLVEAPLLAAETVKQIDDTNHLVIVDCITVLVSNLMLNGGTESEVVSHISALAEHLSCRQSPTLVVSNEVGMGVHPATDLGRQYRDTLGRVNVQLAAHAGSVLLVFAGRVLPLADMQVVLPSSGTAQSL